MHGCKRAEDGKEGEGGRLTSDGGDLERGQDQTDRRSDDQKIHKEPDNLDERRERSVVAGHDGRSCREDWEEGGRLRFGAFRALTGEGRMQAHAEAHSRFWAARRHLTP